MKSLYFGSSMIDTSCKASKSIDVAWGALLMTPSAAVAGLWSLSCDYGHYTHQPVQKWRQTTINYYLNGVFAWFLCHMHPRERRVAMMPTDQRWGQGWFGIRFISFLAQTLFLYLSQYQILTTADVINAWSLVSDHTLSHIEQRQMAEMSDTEL